MKLLGTTGGTDSFMSKKLVQKGSINKKIKRNDGIYETYLSKNDILDFDGLKNELPKDNLRKTRTQLPAPQSSKQSFQKTLGFG